MYNLYDEYDKYNELFFENKLNPTFLDWFIERDGNLGYAYKKTFMNRKKIIINAFYEYPYDLFSSLLVHEMIHVEEYQKGIKEENHGPFFIKRMNEINKLDILKIPINVKYDISNCTINPQFALPLTYMISYDITDNQNYITVFNRYIDKTIPKYLHDMLESKKHIGCKISFYHTNNPNLQHYKIFKSFKDDFYYEELNKFVTEDMKDKFPFIEFEMT